MMNVAYEAGKVIEKDNCTLIEHFLDQGETNLTEKGETNYWAFGYFHTDADLYYCTKYVQQNAGTRAGELNLNSSRRLICPSSPGKY